MTEDRAALRRRAGPVAVALGLALLAPGAWAAMSEAEITRSLEEAYDVKVLRVTQVEREGGSAYRVTIMNAGGDFNEAYQVNTIMVDAETGKLIPQFRHGASGYQQNAAPQLVPDKQSTDAAESGFVWR